MEEIMNKILVVLSLLTLVSCGQSPEDKKRLATISCIGLQQNSSSPDLVAKINAAREEIGGEKIIGGQESVKEAVELGLCVEFVLNENYDEIARPFKERKLEKERIAEEKRVEEQRIAEEKRVEEQRIAEEKRAERERLRAKKEKEIADRADKVKETFHPNGKLKSRENLRLYTRGFSDPTPPYRFIRHGLMETFYESGHREYSGYWVSGKKQGFQTYYSPDGKFDYEDCFTNGQKRSEAVRYVCGNWYDSNEHLFGDAPWAPGERPTISSDGNSVESNKKGFKTLLDSIIPN
jgi:hypothetical protein